ncbi:hypothetical protein [Mastigocoleus testarum]|uniref:hypothetical protein n=1 Tax=Mastigocoleus testarum TaxID=996925 RepID=UPI00137AD6EA|nr:hypothetical protein [Mastigocoleus testarum]
MRKLSTISAIPKNLPLKGYSYPGRRLPNRVRGGSVGRKGEIFIGNLINGKGVESFLQVDNEIDPIQNYLLENKSD